MKKVSIVGAGISGLLIANLFKRNSKYKVTIFERNKLIDLNDGYGIQLSVNSIKILNKIGFYNISKDQSFFPDKLDFYSNKNSKKICDLKISDFNTEDCKYTTLKRSTLINFLKRDLNDVIKIGHNISGIDQQHNKIKLFFDNNETSECDYLIISDGVFSKSKGLLSNDKFKPKYNDTLAIRGSLTEIPGYFNKKNISLNLDSNFHYVIYPINPSGEYNFIGIMKHKLSKEEQNNYSLFSKKSFLEKVLEKVPENAKHILNNLKTIKIFPVFVSDDFYKIENDNINLIGDAFFSFPPSFAQGASQSIESAFELYKSIENNINNDYFKNRVIKTKMINNRSRLNQFAFHISNPLMVPLRNFFLKRLVKNKKFLKNYLGKIYNI